MDEGDVAVLVRRSRRPCGGRPPSPRGRRGGRSRRRRRGRGRRSCRTAACPRCRSSRARRARLHALEVEHHVGVVCGDLGRRDQDRPVLDDRPGADQDPLGAIADRLASPRPRAARRRRGARRRTARAAPGACRRPAGGARRRGSRSTAGEQADVLALAPPAASSGEWKLQAEHFETPTYSSGACSASSGDQDLLEGRERVGAAFVFEVRGSRRSRRGPGARPAARRRSARRASRRSRAAGGRARWMGCRRVRLSFESRIA